MNQILEDENVKTTLAGLPLKRAELAVNAAQFVVRQMIRELEAVESLPAATMQGLEALLCLDRVALVLFGSRR